MERRPKTTRRGVARVPDERGHDVGGAPGKVNLYVGKECVEKGVPTAAAEARLIALIRSQGKWVDPPSLA